MFGKTHVGREGFLPWAPALGSRAAKISMDVPAPSCFRSVIPNPGNSERFIIPPMIADHEE